MKQIVAVILNTFRETARDRVLYVVLGVGVGLLLSTLALGELSANEERRVIIDVGTACLAMLSVFTTLFLGSSLLYKEIDRKTLYVVLPKPIQRWQFLVGKFAGIALTMVVVLAVLGAVLVWILHVQVAPWSPRAWVLPLLLVAALVASLVWLRDPLWVWLPWSLVAFVATLLLGEMGPFDRILLLHTFVLLACEAVLLTAVTMLFSSFSRPFLTGILSLGVWMLGRSAGDMETMPAGMLTPWLRGLLRMLAKVLPNFHLFVPGRGALEKFHDNMPALFAYTGYAVAYALLFTVVLLTISSLLFQRRDLL